MTHSTLTEVDAGSPPYSNGQRPTGSHPALRMLGLPERGDRIAARWMGAGIAAYIGLAGVLVLTLHHGSGFTDGVLTLVGLGLPRNWTVAVLVLSGMMLTGYAIVTIWRDIRTMGKEELDVEWVRNKQREGLNLVFADADERERLFADGVRAIPDTNVKVETLTDDRVRRVQRALQSRQYASVSVEELRVIAEQRTARLGSFARYASSLLLLLAVLGTFAGVKTALPSLIEALGSRPAAAALPAGGGVPGNAPGGTAERTGAPAASGVPTIEELRAPLQAVSGAFGGNALALIGAIAVGLMAQGLAFGRRHLLERLELVSAEYIYGDDTASTSDPLQAAVTALNNTANELHETSGSLVGIETGLQELGAGFERSFEGLSRQLQEMVQRQEEGLYDKTGVALDAVQKRVAELAAVVEQNAGTYLGLVDSIGTRAEETRAAIEQMGKTNEQLAKGIDVFFDVGKRAEDAFANSQRAFDNAQTTFTTLEGASTRIAEANNEVAQRAVAFEAAVATLDHRLKELDESSRIIAQHIAESDIRAREGWTAVSAQVTERLDALTEDLRTIARRGSAAGGQGAAPGQPASGPPQGAVDPELTAVLRRVAAGLTDVLARGSVGAPAGSAARSATPIIAAQDPEVVSLLRQIAGSIGHVGKPQMPPSLGRQLVLQLVPMVVSAAAGVGIALVLLQR